MIMIQYDIIIIGSGIAGLYSAYKIRQFNPDLSVLILEKNKKEWIGGRTNNEPFYGTEVVTGAGIVRKNKDYLLVDLLKQLKIPYHEFISTSNYITQFQPTNINATMRFLKKEYKQEKEDGIINKPIIFKDFATKHLGVKKYKQFIVTSGYSDYEKEDAHDTLYNYGMDDNAGNLTCLSISWKELVAKLVRQIGSENIKAKQKVIKINKISEDQSNFEIETQKGVMYKCNKIIIATTISSLQHLLPSKSSIYKQIHAQPFLRLYAKFSKSSAEIMKEYIKGYTIVEGPLQKIIPMDPDKGVYMIAYSDNASAIALKNHLENTVKNRKYFEDLLEQTLGIAEGPLKINALLDFYWDEGTHYYEPLKGYKNRTAFINDAQHPDKNILVVGEVVSKNQGWTEGALESVEVGLNKKWLLNKTC